MKSYRMLQAALPPAGPQKNVNGPVHSKIIGRFVINLNADTYSKLNLCTEISPNRCVLSFLADKKLKRGISKSVDNSNIVNRQRELILQNVHEKGPDSDIRFEAAKYTFMLPDTTQFPEDFKAFLHKELIETSTLVSLEQAGEFKLSQSCWHCTFSSKKLTSIRISITKLIVSVLTFVISRPIELVGRHRSVSEAPPLCNHR